MASRRKVTSLQLLEFTDIEFLHLLLDHGGEDGWISTEELADEIGLIGDHRNQNVGVRLGWMRRYGCVERNMQPGDPHRLDWRLTELGEQLIASGLRASQLRMFSDMDEGQLWEASRVVGDFLPGMSNAGYHMMRRQWRINISRGGR